MNSNQISAYLHCRQCIEGNLPPNIGVGWTDAGIQVWCENHDINVINIDFEGACHPADITSGNSAHDHLAELMNKDEKIVN